MRRTLEPFCNQRHHRRLQARVLLLRQGHRLSGEEQINGTDAVPKMTVGANKQNDSWCAGDARRLGVIAAK